MLSTENNETDQESKDINASTEKTVQKETTTAKRKRHPICQKKASDQQMKGRWKVICQHAQAQSQQQKSYKHQMPSSNYGQRGSEVPHVQQLRQGGRRGWQGLGWWTSQPPAGWRRGGRWHQLWSGG